MWIHDIMKSKYKLALACISISAVSAGVATITTAYFMSESMRNTGRLYTNTTTIVIAKSLARHGVFITGGQMASIVNDIDSGYNFRTGYSYLACSGVHVTSEVACLDKYGLSLPEKVTE